MLPKEIYASAAPAKAMAMAAARRFFIKGVIGTPAGHSCSAFAAGHTAKDRKGASCTMPRHRRSRQTPNLRQSWCTSGGRLGPVRGLPSPRQLVAHPHKPYVNEEESEGVGAQSVNHGRRHRRGARLQLVQ